MQIKNRHCPKGEMLTLTEKDRIMYNGACYQLITQTYFSGWYECNYELSKTLCEKLIKKGQLIIVNRIIKHYGMELIYYKLAKEEMGGE